MKREARRKRSGESGATFAHGGFLHRFLRSASMLAALKTTAALARGGGEGRVGHLRRARVRDEMWELGES
jgi:hypothetical protein